MIFISGLIWDEWNRKHISLHNITSHEVEEVCKGTNDIVESYRKRILIIGKTKKGRCIAIVLSPEDRRLREYGEGIYYVITAFEREVK